MGYTPHVAVVGGGVLGTAIARDFAIRGLDVTLLEQGTLTTGTTGSMQAILYSGARFVESDPTSALRCREENRVLREIADHCIEETDGILLPGPSDDLDELNAACEERSIPATTVSGSELDEAGIDGSFDRALRVEDAVVDPFALTLANAKDARKYGAAIETGAAVVDLLTDNGQIAGVEVEYRTTPESHPAPTTAPEIERDDGAEAETGAEADGDETEVDAEDGDESGEENGDEDAADDDEDEKEMPGEVQRSFPVSTDDDKSESGEREEIEADFVVNAAGAWADHVAALAGIELPVVRKRGRLLVLEGRQCDTIVSVGTGVTDGVSATPYHGNTVVGPVAGNGEESVSEAFDAVESMLPASAAATVLRSYSGVWTQHGSKSGPPAGPGPTLIDHNKYDDKWGLLSVVGATVTTHRYVAERAVDRVCSEFGIDRACRTDELSLPDPSLDGGDTTSSHKALSRAREAAKRARSGGSAGDDPNPVLCEATDVRRDTVRRALDESEPETDLTNVRIRTGATMGRCQGGRCGHRIAAELFKNHDPETVDESLAALLQGRWQGRVGTARGEQLRRALRDYEFHATVLCRDDPDADSFEFEAFDDGDGLVIPERTETVDVEPIDGLDLIETVPRTADGRVMMGEVVR